MPMHLFPDTNVWLSFYHLTKDELEELHKVAVLIDQKRLTLYLPEQVVDEFWRNRDAKVADAMKRLKAEMLSEQFPQMCKQYAEYRELRRIIVQYKRVKSRLVEKLTADYAAEELDADQTIQDLFSKAKRVKFTDDILLRAKLRYDLGNPPGKQGSYGDAVNWECLLAEVPDGEHLYFITDDGDYCAKTNEEEFCPFLRREWKKKKAGELRFYKRLSAFFQDHYPNIKLATELEKELLLRDLTESYSFARTRAILRKLVRITDFSAAQVNEIVDAAIGNSQIYLVARDNDINDYLQQLINGRESDISPDKLEQFQKTVSKETTAEEEREEEG